MKPTILLALIFPIASCLYDLEVKGMKPREAALKCVKTVKTKTVAVKGK